MLINYCNYIMVLKNINFIVSNENVIKPIIRL